MKFVFDTDGTLTDFNQFIKDNAYEYFEKEYGMSVVHPEKLELEDIFDMDNFFIKRYSVDLPTAQTYTKRALDRFWVSISRFTRFSLLGKFRQGTSSFINECIKNNHIVEIHTSRAKTTENSLIGEIARKFTYLQYKLNGVHVPYSSFHFYKNDEEKLKGIIASSPDVVFDDKPEILERLNENSIKTICVSGNHNQNVVNSSLMQKVYDFQNIEVALDKLLKNKSYSLSNRIYSSDLFYKKLRTVIPIILNEFNPIILNKENLIDTKEESVVISPNHQSTVDPLIITSIIDKNIHWAALKRFFDGNDSIFNNSKNPLLCKITAYSFKKFEYFPIERLRDNPKANNIKSLKEMTLFLKNKQYVGIFPEGTTNKSEEKDFGHFEPSFIMLAEKGNAWIQPVTVLWLKDLNIKHKIIVNFGEPFKVENMTKEEAYNKYINIQQQCLEENKNIKRKLSGIKQKTLKK